MTAAFIVPRENVSNAALKMQRHPEAYRLADDAEATAAAFMKLANLIRAKQDDFLFCYPQDAQQRADVATAYDALLMLAFEDMNAFVESVLTAAAKELDETFNRDATQAAYDNTISDDFHFITHADGDYLPTNSTKEQARQYARDMGYLMLGGSAS